MCLLSQCSQRPGPPETRAITEPKTSQSQTSLDTKPGNKRDYSEPFPHEERPHVSAHTESRLAAPRSPGRGAGVGEGSGYSEP